MLFTHATLLPSYMERRSATHIHPSWPNAVRQKDREPLSKKLLVIFKYSRVSEQEPPNGSRPRIRNYRPDRQSNEPPRGSSFLDYEHFATANNGALGVFSVFDNSF